MSYAGERRRLSRFADGPLFFLFPVSFGPFSFYFVLFFLVFYKHIYAIIIPRIISSVIFFFFSFFFFLGVRNKRVGDTRRLKWKIFFFFFGFFALTGLRRRQYPEEEKKKGGKKLYTLLFRADIWEWIKQVPREWFKKKQETKEIMSYAKIIRYYMEVPFLKTKKKIYKFAIYLFTYRFLFLLVSKQAVRSAI